MHSIVMAPAAEAMLAKFPRLQVRLVDILTGILATEAEMRSAYSRNSDVSTMPLCVRIMNHIISYSIAPDRTCAYVVSVDAITDPRRATLTCSPKSGRKPA